MEKRYQGPGIPHDGILLLVL